MSFRSDGGGRYWSRPTESTIPVSGKGWRNDTTNSTVLVTENSSVCGAGSTYYYGWRTGWTTWIKCDYRGDNGATGYSAAYRTITGGLSTTSGLNVITATGGNAFTQDDVGQRVLSSGYIDSTITEIIAGGTQARTTGNASNSGSGLTATFHHHTPYSGAASTVFDFVGSRNPVNIIGGADEGFQKFLTVGGSDLIGTINIQGATIQSQIECNHAVPVNLDGCRLNSGTFRDAVGVTPRITLKGCSIDSTTIWGVVLPKPKLFDYELGASIVQFSLNVEEGATQQFFGMPTLFHDTVATVGFTDALLTAASVKITGGGTPKPLIRFGLRNAATDVLEHYYDIARHGVTGHAYFTGSQELFYRGYDFDAVLKAVTYVGDIETPAEFTFDQHNWTPATSAKYYRISASVPINMTGMGEYKNQVFGEEHEYWNVGTVDITIKHFDSGSAQLNRYRTDTGADIILKPNQILKLVYDSTNDVSKQGWRVYKSNSSGVSDGDKGDITVSGGGTIWTIDNGVLSLAKMAPLAAYSFIANNTASSATPVALSVSGARTLLGLDTDDAVTFGNLTVNDLIVNGTTITVNTATMTVDDPLIRLADNNGADSVDIGYYGLYTAGVSKYAGLFRDASDGKFRLFTGLEAEPGTTVNTAGTGYAAATLVANLESSNAAITGGSITGITDLAIADGGTGASTAANAATNFGLGTGDSPQFAALNLGHASDTTLGRVSAGDISVEGKLIYRADGTDVPIADGGTNASSFGTTNGLVYFNGTSLVNDADATFDGTQMRLSDANTSQSQFRVGGFEVQNYALNNLFFADNMYYDGSNFKYRSTGYAEMLRFLNGEISFYTAASGTAGNVPTLTAQLRIDNTGIGLFNVQPIARPTTSVASATIVINSGNAINDATTFNGYTIAQIARALQLLGPLT